LRVEGLPARIVLSPLFLPAWFPFGWYLANGSSGKALA
jgi:hypothetical protein